MKAALLAFLFAAASPAAPRVVHGEFSWEEPQGWSSRDDWTSAVPAYTLSDGQARISVTFYRAGNPLFATAQAYRAHRLAARGGGEKPKRAGTAVTASGKAEAWEQDTADPVSGVHGAARAAAPMRERFTVLERSGAFWVLSVKAPRARFAAAAQAFAAALAGFRVLTDPGKAGKNRL